MEETAEMSKDRIKEEIKNANNKKSIFFWIAASFIFPILFIAMVILSIVFRPTTLGYKAIIVSLMIGGSLLYIESIFAKKYLHYKEKYNELKDKL